MLRPLLFMTFLGISLCCQRGSDCAVNECCVILDDGTQVCQEFIKLGDVCHVLSGRSPFEKPDFPVRECICQGGALCVPDDPQRPLGAKGTCQQLLVS